jgi:site-specific recombinase XerD
MQSTFKRGAAKARKQISWRKTQRSVYRKFRYPDGSEKEEHFPLRTAIKHKGITIREIPLKVAGPSFECDIPAKISDKRDQKRFKTKDEAIAYAEQAVIRRENKGLEGFNLQSDQQQDALKAFKTLAARGTLQEAAKFFIAHHFPKGGDINLVKLQAKHEKHLANLNRRPHTLRENTSRLNDLISHFKPNTLVKNITTDALSTYLQSNPQWSDHTRQSHFVIIRSFLNFAVVEKYLQTNPINDVKRPPKPKNNKPDILTIKQTSKLLDAILNTDNGNLKFIGPYVTLGLFCGIRTNELDQLNWEDIRLDKEYVAISETIAKKHRARNVAIMPNAIQWLHAFGIDESGSIRKPNHRRTFESAQKASNIGAWPKNAMRHSYASYFYEMTGDETKVINQLGQRRADVLFTHYLTLTDKGEGTEYFSITPPQKTDNLVRFPVKVVSN